MHWHGSITPADAARFVSDQGLYDDTRPGGDAGGDDSTLFGGANPTEPNAECESNHDSGCAQISASRATSAPSATPVAPETWTRAVLITTPDGRATVDGVSGGLGNDADAAVLAACRDAADVIVVGAATVRAEDYGGHHPSDEVRRKRRAAGRAGAAPVAVVTRSARIVPDSRLLRDAEEPPIIVTPRDAGAADDAGDDEAAARRARLDALRDAGARLLELDSTEPADVRAALAELGLHRISLEGGPSLYRAWIDAGCVDELTLTLAPVVASSGAAAFPDGPPAHWRLHAAAHGDSHVFLRYLRTPGR
ncbi:dihydrofolate reductase family protein [Corynebacterium sp. 335C]